MVLYVCMVLLVAAKRAVRRQAQDDNTKKQYVARRTAKTSGTFNLLSENITECVRTQELYASIFCRLFLCRVAGGTKANPSQDDNVMCFPLRQTQVIKIVLLSKE